MLTFAFMMSPSYTFAGGCARVACFGRLVNGLADAGIGSAAAEIAAHGDVDIGVGGVRIVREESGGGHDLAGLAIAALGHIMGFARLLQGVGCVF